jgi:ribosome-binding factor A
MNDIRMPSNRQLKVGETIKRALSEIFSNQIHEPSIEGISVIISEVRMTPDLRLANIYIFFLFNESIDKDNFLRNMVELTPRLKGMLVKKITLRYMPELKFILDDSFENASNINNALKD